MFVDFDKVFNNKPQTELQIPDALVKYLSSQLPAGVKYTIDSTGNLSIATDEESINIGGFVFRPTEEHKKVLGENFTREDVVAYMYNTQKPIPLTLKKDGYITLNGEEFPIEKMSYNPLYPVGYSSGKFFMRPNPFPKPFTMKVGCGKYERELVFSRVPHNSVRTAVFKSHEDEPLKIEIYADETSEDIKFNITYNLSKANSVKDIVSSASIFNALFDGKATFGGKPFNAKIDDGEIKKYDSNSIVFWEKVLEIEKILNITFASPYDDVDFKVVCLVEELYQNLTNQNPIKNNKRIDSINGEWQMVSDEELQNSMDKGVYFEFEAVATYELFNQIIELPCLIGIFNTKVSRCEKMGNKYTLFLDDESEEKQMFISSLCFSNDNELKKYQDIDNNERITAFSKAKKPHEFLK